MHTACSTHPVDYSWPPLDDRTNKFNPNEILLAMSKTHCAHRINGHVQLE